MDAALAADWRQARAWALAGAGAAPDMPHRAEFYARLYRHSAGNFAFALIAAHACLWGARYVRRGLAVGGALAALSRAQQWHRAQIEGFAVAMRSINLDVAVEVATLYRLTAARSDAAGLDAIAAPPLLAALGELHRARRQGRLLPLETRRRLFHDFLLWEQHSHVAAAVDRAVAALDWPWVRRLALMPRLGLAYIPWRLQARFRNFASMDERVEKGLHAFDMAERQGWQRCAALLRVPPQPSQMPPAMAPATAARFSALSEKPISTVPVETPASSCWVQ